MSLDLLIRADASPSIGTGHVMRCLALARTALAEGFCVKMLGHVTVPWLEESLKNSGVLFENLSPQYAFEQSINLKFEQATTSSSWIVLDGYHFVCDYQKSLRQAGYKLLVIDDYAHLPAYSCDILLNQNIGAEQLQYAGDIGTKLLGLEYTLLQPEFLEARKIALAQSKKTPPKNILITLGGGDFAKFLPEVAKSLNLPELQNATVKILQGSMSKSEIEAAFSNAPFNIEIIERCNNMPSLFLETDLCISAGGSTCWELCAMGVPFLTVQIAINQKNIVQGLAEQKIAPIFSKDNLLEMFNGKVHNEYRQKLFAFVDGLGARRVLREIYKKSLSLHLAEEKDCWEVLAIANDPEVRQNSLSSHEISKEEHQKWFLGRIKKNEEEPFYLAFIGGSLVGYIRLDKNGKDTAHISIALSPKWRGKNVGSFFIEQATILATQYNINTVYAIIKQNNVASQKTFAKANFQYHELKDQIYCMAWQPKITEDT